MCACCFCVVCVCMYEYVCAPPCVLICVRRLLVCVHALWQHAQNRKLATVHRHIVVAHRRVMLLGKHFRVWEKYIDVVVRACPSVLCVRALYVLCACAFGVCKCLVCVMCVFFLLCVLLCVCL